MAKAKKPEEAKKGSPEWMATYSDMITLLMCFFVLLLASASMDADKFKAIAASMPGNPMSLMSAVGSTDSIMDFIGSGITEMPDLVEVTGDSKEEYEKAKEELTQMASDFKTYFAENNFTEEKILIEQGEQEIKIRFADGIMFDSGQATLKPGAREILDLIVQELNNYPDNNIKIEGHTDNVPIRTAIFPSNWMLSAARAVTVAEYLVDEKGISPLRVEQVGYGENRPIVDNDTAENRAKNRRVEINIVSKYYSAS